MKDVKEYARQTLINCDIDPDSHIWEDLVREIERAVNLYAAEREKELRAQFNIESRKLLRNEHEFSTQPKRRKRHA